MSLNDRSIIENPNPKKSILFNESIQPFYRTKSNSCRCGHEEPNVNEEFVMICAHSELYECFWWRRRKKQTKLGELSH